MIPRYESQAMKLKDQMDELKQTMNDNLKMTDYGRMLTERMATKLKITERPTHYTPRIQKEDSKLRRSAAFYQRVIFYLSMAHNYNHGQQHLAEQFFMLLSISQDWHDIKNLVYYYSNLYYKSSRLEVQRMILRLT